MTRLAVLLISVIGAASVPGRARADGGTDGELASALALLTTLPADEPEAHELMDLLLPGERYGSCEDLCLPFLFEDDAEHRRLEQERQDRKVRLQVVYSLLALNAERSFPVLLRLFEENAGHVESGCPTPPGIPPPPDLRFPTDMVMMDQDLPPLVWRWGDGQCRSWEVKDEKIVVALRV
ncbi:MAG: hypothetical protein FJ098_12800, partial [Deltaproteobacteria bacterium]|nr:hypothetical protein [Deltaproteobacteria bacterium]